MQKIHFSIEINAPKKHVWHTMLDDAPYRRWTAVFAKGSHYVGNWNKGSKILFLAPADTGEMGGMVSRIADNRPYEYLSIEHLGVVKNGVEDTTGPEAQKWAPAYENYTFKEKDGKTVVSVDMDIEDSYKKMFEDLWPKALQALKTLAERVTTTVVPYLHFTSNAAEAMKFYHAILGGKLNIQTFGDAKMADSDDQKNLVIHAELESEAIRIMASDMPPGYGTVVKGNNVNLCIIGTQADKLTTYFNKLSEGGSITMPLAKQFWGDTFGSFEDKFGIRWMVTIS